MPQISRMNPVTNMNMKIDSEPLKSEPLRFFSVLDNVKTKK